MTTKEIAFSLFNTYVEGWKENDIKKIILPLSEDCEVIESHGPVYHGVLDVKKWFKLWMEAESVVEIWDIRSFYYYEDSSVFEWKFSCMSHQQRYAFPGITVVKFFKKKFCYCMNTE